MWYFLLDDNLTLIKKKQKKRASNWLLTSAMIYCLNFDLKCILINYYFLRICCLFFTHKDIKEDMPPDQPLTFKSKKTAAGQFACFSSA